MLFNSYEFLLGLLPIAVLGFFAFGWPGRALEGRLTGHRPAGHALAIARA